MVADVNQPRTSLLLPIVGGVVAVLLAISVLVGWTLIFTEYYFLRLEVGSREAPSVGYWMILATGCAFLISVVATLVWQLASYARQTLYVRRQETFVDSVTHELKSPLASLRLAIDTMTQREVPAHDRRHFLQMMSDDVDRLQSFIEHILEAGRLTHDERDFMMEPLDATKLVRDCADLVRRRHGVRPDAFRFEAPEESEALVVVCDATALQIIAHNLLDNAVKYSFGDPEITISVSLSDRQLHLEVADRGVGIPPGQLRKVFRRFYRVDHSGRPRARGTGLGLFVVSSLVAKLGGAVTAESPGADGGSTFRVHFPVELPTAKPSPAVATPPVPTAQPSSG